MMNKRMAHKSKEAPNFLWATQADKDLVSSALPDLPPYEVASSSSNPEEEAGSASSGPTSLTPPRPRRAKTRRYTSPVVRVLQAPAQKTPSRAKTPTPQHLSKCQRSPTKPETPTRQKASARQKSPAHPVPPADPLLNTGSDHEPPQNTQAVRNLVQEMIAESLGPMQTAILQAIAAARSSEPRSHLTPVQTPALAQRLTTPAFQAQASWDELMEEDLASPDFPPNRPAREEHPTEPLPWGWPPLNLESWHPDLTEAGFDEAAPRAQRTPTYQQTDDATPVAPAASSGSLRESGVEEETHSKFEDVWYFPRSPLVWDPHKRTISFYDESFGEGVLDFKTINGRMAFRVRSFKASNKLFELLLHAQRAVPAATKPRPFPLFAALTAPSLLPGAAELCGWKSDQETEVIECTLSEKLKNLLLSPPKIWAPEDFTWQSKKLTFSSKDSSSRDIFECLQSSPLRATDCSLKGPYADKLVPPQGTLLKAESTIRASLAQAIQCRVPLEMLVSLTAPDFVTSMESTGDFLLYVSSLRQALKALGEMMDRNVAFLAQQFHASRRALRERVLEPLKTTHLRDMLLNAPPYGRALWSGAVAKEAQSEASEAIRDRTLILQKKRPSADSQGRPAPRLPVPSAGPASGYRPQSYRSVRALRQGYSTPYRRGLPQRRGTGLSQARPYAVQAQRYHPYLHRGAVVAYGSLQFFRSTSRGAPRTKGSTLPTGALRSRGALVARTQGLSTQGYSARGLTTSSRAPPHTTKQ